MPHYADGTLAKVGDLVIDANNSSIKSVSIVLDITEASACNCSVMPIARQYPKMTIPVVHSPWGEGRTLCDLLAVRPFDQRPVVVAAPHDELSPAVPA